MRLVEGEGSPETGACWMSAIAWYAGEDWNDIPACVCPVLRYMAIAANDMLPSDCWREHLIGPVLFEVVGTNDRDMALPRARALLEFVEELDDLNSDAAVTVTVARGMIDKASDPTTCARDAYTEDAVTALTNAVEMMHRERCRVSGGYSSLFLVKELIDLIVKLAREGTRQEVPQVRRLEDIPAYAEE